MQGIYKEPELASVPPARRMKSSSFSSEKPLKGEPYRASRGKASVEQSSAGFSEPSEVKRPRFPKDLLDKEGFVDPRVEASILAPQHSVAASQIVLEAAALSGQMNGRKQQRESFFSSISEYLAAFLGWVKTKFRGNRRARARLTRQGEMALSQLQYLSALCDATSHRSPEEVLAAEAAFGEAYYEIMSLSANLEKMAEKEASHHLHRYSRHMAAVLRAVD